MFPTVLFWMRYPEYPDASFLKMDLRWVTGEWLIKVRTVISDYRQAFSNSFWEKMTNWCFIEVFDFFYEEIDSQGSTDQNRLVPNRSRTNKNFETSDWTRTRKNEFSDWTRVKIFPYLRQIRSDWSSDLVVRGSLLIEMSEEVILVKSEDDENVPKSPVYLSETTSESSKPEAVSVIR